MPLSKSEQSRINGAKSTGPTTPEGKTRAASNSTRHGFFAKTVCISTEDKDAFEHFRQDYFDRYNPIDEPEINLVEKIVCAVWRQHRLWDIERVLLEKEMHETDPQYSFQVPESTWRLANAFTRGQPISDALDRLYKIESHFDRMAARSDRTLRLLQKTRPPAGSVPPPSPLCLSGEPKPQNSPNEPEDAPPESITIEDIHESARVCITETDRPRSSGQDHPGCVSQPRAPVD